jgi:hypothetical protein
MDQCGEAILHTFCPLWNVLISFTPGSRRHLNALQCKSNRGDIHVPVLEHLEKTRRASCQTARKGCAYSSQMRSGAQGNGSLTNQQGLGAYTMLVACVLMFTKVGRASCGQA